MFCNSFDRGNGVEKSDYASNASLRIIPYLITQINQQFKLKNSTFQLEQYKNSSARQVFFNEFKIVQSFTLENSFFKRLRPGAKEEKTERSNTEVKRH